MGKMSNSLNNQLMSIAMKGTTLKGDANSEIKSYTLSEEELAKYRAMPAPEQKNVKNSNSKIWGGTDMKIEQPYSKFCEMCRQDTLQPIICTICQTRVDDEIAICSRIINLASKLVNPYLRNAIMTHTNAHRQTLRGETE